MCFHNCCFLTYGKVTLQQINKAKEVSVYNMHYDTHAEGSLAKKPSVAELSYSLLKLIAAIAEGNAEIANQVSIDGK